MFLSSARINLYKGRECVCLVHHCLPNTQYGASHRIGMQIYLLNEQKNDLRELLHSQFLPVFCQKGNPFFRIHNPS